MGVEIDWKTRYHSVVKYQRYSVVEFEQITIVPCLRYIVQNVDR